MGKGYLLISHRYLGKTRSLPDCDGEVMPTGRGVVDLQGKKKKKKGSSIFSKQNLVPPQRINQVIIYRNNSLLSEHRLLTNHVLQVLAQNTEASFPYGTPWLSNSLNKIFSASLLPIIEVLKSFFLPSHSALPGTLNFTYIYPSVHPFIHLPFPHSLHPLFHLPTDIYLVLISLRS